MAGECYNSRIAKVGAIRWGFTRKKGCQVSCGAFLAMMVFKKAMEVSKKCDM